MERHAAGLLIVGGWLCLLVGLGGPPRATAQEPTPTMAVGEIRVGMKGYGKTVFHGDTIEAFACEVVSVVSDSTAKHATIWVICPDERMQRSGPVQGMSGSPIYLWDEGEEGELGKGGRLIGAFAFGYSDVNVCLVGVQPIAYMREVGERALAEVLEPTKPQLGDASGDVATPPEASPEARTEARTLSGTRTLPEATHGTLPDARPRTLPGGAGRSLAALQAAADRLGAPASQRVTLDAVQRVIEAVSPKQSWTPLPTRAAHTAAPHAATASGQPVPMYLPMSVGDAQTAALLAPLLEPAGVTVMAGGLAMVAGKPPSNVDPARVKLEPGSVLSIPLAYGDIDFNAAGTVTDVLPDGTVLAFGHAMNAVGSSRLPMATGYTHFVVSRNSMSFKLASSLEIVGTIVRDEAVAVAGTPEKVFAAAPVAVHVELPGQPRRDYAYHVIDDPQFTPAIFGAVIASSITAVQVPPTLHTVHATGTLTFTGGRTFDLDSLIPGGGIGGLMFDLLPPVIAMMQNPFEPLQLEAAEVSIKIEDGLRAAAMVEARLDHSVIQPGGTLTATLTLQPFEAAAFTKILPFTVPTDLPEGEYQLILSGPEAYTHRMLAARPDLTDVDDVDELLAALQAIAGVDRQMIYVGVPRPMPGLTLNGQALADLPSSRVAVLASTASSTLMPYPRFVEQTYPADQVIGGELTLTFRVQHAAP